MKQNYLKNKQTNRATQNQVNLKIKNHTTVMNHNLLNLI